MNDSMRKAAYVFLENHQLVLQTAFRNAPLPGMAEDIAQDVFIEFVNLSERWDYSKSMKALLAAITRNTALRYWREYRKNLPENLAEIFEKIRNAGEREVGGRETDHSAQMQIHALNICLEKLSPKNREMMNLLYRDRLSMREVADMHDKSVNAVCLIVFRLREKLRFCINTVLSGPSIG